MNKQFKNATFRFNLSHYQAIKIKSELEYIIRIQHEVMLFTLETQSSKKPPESRSLCVLSDSHVDEQHKSLKHDRSLV